MDHTWAALNTTQERKEVQNHACDEHTHNNKKGKGCMNHAWWVQNAGKGCANHAWFAQKHNTGKERGAWTHHEQQWTQQDRKGKGCVNHARRAQNTRKGCMKRVNCTETQHRKRKGCVNLSESSLITRCTKYTTQERGPPYHPVSHLTHLNSMLWWIQGSTIVPGNQEKS
jgi:hypothetical protein